MRLKGKTALVTGGASGFGAGIARRFAAEGARVVIADLNEDLGRNIAGEIGGLAVRTDVTVAADVRAAVAAAAGITGRLDILVNNAGMPQRPQPLTAMDEASFDRLYAVNVKSVYLSAVTAVPLMQKQGGGSILNVASTAAVRPRPNLTWYNGSKGAMLTLTKSMAVELAPRNIRVNAINPVAGTTPMLKEFMGGAETDEGRARFIATIPMGRLSTPLDIANAALFLCSDEAEFVTGVCMEVDGGRCI